MDIKRFIKYTIFLILLIPGIVFAGSQQVSETLASTIITNARMYLNDTTATYFHTDAEMLVYLNDGSIDIVARTNCLESVENITLQADTINYPLTDPYIVIKNVIYDARDTHVVNGTMEADSSWADTAAPPTTNTQSTAEFYHGSYSRRFSAAAADQGIQSNVFTTVTGTTYYYNLFVYPATDTEVNVYIYKGDDSGAIVDVDKTSLVAVGWNAISGSYTETAGGAGAYIAIRSSTGGGAGVYYIDNVSVYTQGFLKPLIRGSLVHMTNVDPELGEPSYWADWGNDLFVYPRPNSDCDGRILEVLTLDRPTAVAAGDDVLVPAYYDKALTLYIAAQALKKDAKYAQSNAIIAEYQAELDRYRADFTHPPEDRKID